jgi:HEAT repeat protein
MPVFYCWHCYHEVTGEHAVCPYCGRATEPPDDADYTRRLVWALRHPLPDRQLLAAQTVGRRGDPAAIPALRELVTDPDPYVAAAALTSLVTLAGLDTLTDLVRDLADGAVAAPVRAAARHLLAGGDP